MSHTEVEAQNGVTGSPDRIKALNLGSASKTRLQTRRQGAAAGEPHTGQVLL